MTKIPVDNPKPPLDLYIKKDDEFKPTGVVACGECGTVYYDRPIAENCCKQKYCKCGKKIEQYYTMCSDCSDQKMLDKAVEVSAEEYSGPFCCEGDKFFEDLGEVFEYFEDEEKEDRPEHLYCCDIDKWHGLDIDDMLDSSLDGHYEEAIENVVDYDELKKFLDKWNKKQTIESWTPDYKKHVKIPWED